MTCSRCGRGPGSLGPRGGKFDGLHGPDRLCRTCYGWSRAPTPNRKGTPDFGDLRRDYWIDRFGQPYWTEERIVAAIRRWAERTGRPPLYTEWLRGRRGYTPHVNNRRSDRPSAATVLKVFGRWSAAIEAAGVEHPAATHCKRGHAYGPNDYDKGKRRCRECRNAAKRAARRRKAA